MGCTPVKRHSSPVIGIRDSGVGGLTVAREVRRLLPHAPLLYFADTANVPYGNRSPQELCKLAFSVTQFLQDQGADIVIFACNSTSAHALEPARKYFSIPLLGMIEGVTKMTALAPPLNKSIGILATCATVESHSYSRHMQYFSPHIHCLEVACPQFVPLVESQQIDSASALAACEEALKPIIAAEIKTVILGCTHFPLLLPTLQQIAPHIDFIDPAQTVARETAALLKSTFADAQSWGEDENLTKLPLETYFASGQSEMLQRWICRLMPGNELPQICKAPHFSPS